MKKQLQIKPICGVPKEEIVIGTVRGYAKLYIHTDASAYMHTYAQIH